MMDFSKQLSPWDNDRINSWSYFVSSTICSCYYVGEIQCRLDSFARSAPNQYVFEISSHFQILYPLIIEGSLVFHLIYGSLLGFMTGRMTGSRIFSGEKEKRSLT
jgi:hypothetical protein